MLAWVALMVVSVVCIDQASKAMLLNRSRLNRSVRVSRGVRLRHVVSVGWVPGVRSPTGWLLLWGVAVSSGLLMLELDGFGEGGARAGVAVALGGATGNLLDRVLRGHIVDFIEIGFWPIFNVADVGIVAGLGLTLTAVLL
jgi:signal peptidase II